MGIYTPSYGYGSSYLCGRLHTDMVGVIMANLVSLKMDIAQAKMFVMVGKLTVAEALASLVSEYDWLLADQYKHEAIMAQRLIGQLQDDLMKVGAR